MRARFHGEADVRRTERYLGAVDELKAYAELHRFEGAGSFYAWERLNILIERLSRLYDAFELEGDVAPVRREVELFQNDMWRLHVKPDQWVVGHLTQFLAELESGAPVVEVLTGSVPQLPAVAWPDSYLAVHPRELEALLGRKTQPPSPLPPGA